MNRLFIRSKKVVLYFVVVIASKHRALAGAVGVGINKNGPHNVQAVRLSRALAYDVLTYYMQIKA